MKARLLKSSLGRFEPRAKPYDVWDTELPGLVLRVLPTGRQVYYLVYRLKGRRSRYMLGVSPQVSPEGARSLARAVAGEVASQRDPNERRKGERRETERAKSSTLRAFLDGKYATWAASNMKTADFQLTRLKSDFRDWLEKPMASITPWLIEGYRKKRREAGRSPKTINRELQRLRAVAARAVAFGVLEVHPFASVKPLKTDKGGRVRYLSADEQEALKNALYKREEGLRAARDRFNAWRKARHVKPLPARTSGYVDHLHPMVLLAMNTGLRRGELLSLRWGEVNVPGKMLTVRGHTAKTGQTRRVPLNVEALGALTAWRKQVEDDSSEAYVFAGSDGRRLGSVDRSWESATNLAELEDFRFHDLRHHFASRLVLEGVPLNTVRELLGHTTIEMTMRYAHLAPEALATAVEKLAGARV